jgi:lipoprotein-releasing system permease protein
MFKPLALYIALRYVRAKRRNHFISFISLAAMIGIILSVAVLITVLSVFNGFNSELHNKIFAIAPQITITGINKPVKDWQALRTEVLQQKEIVAAAPFIAGEGFLTNSGEMTPVYISGVAPNDEATISQIAHKVVAGSFTHLKPESFGLVLGQKLVRKLKLKLGDQIQVMILHNDENKEGESANFAGMNVSPTFQMFTLMGIVGEGAGLGFDEQVAYINLQDAQTLLQVGQGVTGLHLKIKDVYAAPQIADELMQRLDMSYWVSDWTKQYGSFFRTIEMNKTMMFMILILLVAIAAFNLVSSLTMVVTDKKADVAILRTLGATPSTILYVFIFQGIFIGIIGTFFGLIGGVILSLNVTHLVDGLQKILGVQLLSSEVYFLNYLPSKLMFIDIVEICGIALLLSFLATIYPACRAFLVQPAEALRYE